MADENGSTCISIQLSTMVETLDALCQEQSTTLVALIDAIGKLSQDDTVRNLAAQARSLAEHMSDEVNVFAESLGSNHKDGQSYADRLYGALQ